MPQKGITKGYQKTKTALGKKAVLKIFRFSKESIQNN